MRDWYSLSLSEILLYCVFARRSDQLFSRLPSLPIPSHIEPLPPLSIIIPARNEAVNLRRTLPGLMTIQYPGLWEAIIVDDNSSDDTAEIAERYGAQIVKLEGLPSGWLGKPHACHVGALRARGRWLLFTDADVYHTPDGAARAVAYALRECLDGLSLFLPHHHARILEKVVFMSAYAGLFSGLCRVQGLLNGQYILIQSDVYHASGGFSKVRSDKLEDLAFGMHLRRCGYHVPVLRGEGAGCVQRYANPGDLWAGLMRLGEGTLEHLGAGAALTALMTTLTAKPMIGLVAAFIKGKSRFRAVLEWLVISLGSMPWARREGSFGLAFLAPLGAFLMLLAAVMGMARRLLGLGVNWKGRRV